MADSRSPYEPIGFREERKKLIRSLLKQGKLEEVIRPYDLTDAAILNEIMLEDD